MTFNASGQCQRGTGLDTIWRCVSRQVDLGSNATMRCLATLLQLRGRRPTDAIHRRSEGFLLLNGAVFGSISATLASLYEQSSEVAECRPTQTSEHLRLQPKHLLHYVPCIDKPSQLS